MKYNIHGFHQPRAVELGLTNDDLLVLRWFVDFAGTNKMKTIVEQDGIYYWVNYTTVLEDLPVLRISKQTLKKKHFDNLCNARVLKHKHIKDGGSFSYYAYGINYDTLIYLQDSTPTLEFTNPTSDFTKGYVENELTPTSDFTQGVGINVPNKDYSINNTSINNYSINNNKKSLFDVVEENFGRTLNPIEYEEISKWEDNELTRYAIKEAILNNARGIKYINTILASYKAKNILTIEEAIKDKERYKKGKEPTPVWLDKKVEKKEASEEEKKEIEEMLNEFKEEKE